MKRKKKKILGWILVVVYFSFPLFLSKQFGFPDSIMEAWNWANIPIIIAIWELLIRDWLFK